MKKLGYLIIILCTVAAAVLAVVMWHEYNYQSYSDAKLVYGEEYDYLHYA